jgi:MFS family permease
MGDVHEEKPSTQEREFFVSFFALGAAVGALFGGQLADLVGRKWMTIIGDVIIAGGFLIIILTNGIFGGFFGRVVSGLG